MLVTALCLWGWEFLLLPPQPPRVFSVRGLRLCFPELEPWVAQSVSLLSSSSWFICSQVWDRPVPQLPPLRVRQPLPCHVSSPPGCLSPPLLLVWMDVSSLPPWLSDFRTVRFSVSSGCFLFLNCCCPSFGCVRRHSVSTYASILAGRNSSYSSLPKKMTLNAVSIFPKTLTELLISSKKNWFESPAKELWDGLKNNGKIQNLTVLILDERQNISNKFRKMNKYPHEIEPACCGNSS